MPNGPPAIVPVAALEISPLPLNHTAAPETPGSLAVIVPAFSTAPPAGLSTPKLPICAPIQ